MIEDEYKLLLAQTILGQMCHGLKVNFRIFDHSEEKMVELVGDVFSFDIYHGYIVGISSGGIDYQVDMMKVKPYLRPLESMTDDEKSKLKSAIGVTFKDDDNGRHSELYGYAMVYHKSYFEEWFIPYECNDWCDRNHFDYRGLIDKCLALPAPDGMYNKYEILNI